MNAQPSRRDRFRPLELIGLAFVVAIFTGVVVLITARDVNLAVIFFGGAFVVALVGLAMLALVADRSARTRRTRRPTGSARKARWPPAARSGR